MKRKRAILLFLAVALALANVFWFSTRTRQQVEDFQVDLTSHAIEYDARSEVDYPLFEPADSQWSLNGYALHSIVPYLVDSDPENLGPDGIGEYLAFRLPDGSGADEVRRAFLALASEGICQVAILDRANSQDGAWQSDIIKIKAVRHDDGTLIGCKHRFKT